jgi:hypothetical protein
VKDEGTKDQGVGTEQAKQENENGGRDPAVLFLSSPYTRVPRPYFLNPKILRASAGVATSRP